VAEGESWRGSWRWRLHFPGLTCDEGMRVLDLALRELGVQGHLIDPMSTFQYGIDEDGAESVRYALTRAGKNDKTTALVEDITNWLQRLEIAERLSPPGPSLIIGLYTDRGSDARTFASLCQVIAEIGNKPTGIFQICPAGSEPDARLDIEGVEVNQAMSSAQFMTLVNRADEAVRVIAAKFYTKAFTPMIVRYGIRDDAGRYTFEVNIRDEVPGKDPRFWTLDEQARVRDFMNWARGLLRSACEHMDPLYGSIDELSVLLPPSLLRYGRRGIANLFVSDRLLSISKITDAELRALCGDESVSCWGSGLYFSGWDPSNPNWSPLQDIDDRSMRAAAILSDALSRYFHSKAVKWAKQSGTILSPSGPRSDDTRAESDWQVDFPRLARAQAMRLQATAAREFELESDIIDPHLFYTLRIDRNLAKFLMHALIRNNEDGVDQGIAGLIDDWLERTTEGSSSLTQPVVESPRSFGGVSRPGRSMRSSIRRRKPANCSRSSGSRAASRRASSDPCSLPAARQVRRPASVSSMLTFRRSVGEGRRLMKPRRSSASSLPVIAAGDM
jgi:hypothetical protein